MYHDASRLKTPNPESGLHKGYVSGYRQWGTNPPGQQGQSARCLVSFSGTNPRHGPEMLSFRVNYSTSHHHSRCPELGAPSGGPDETIADT